MDKDEKLITDYLLTSLDVKILSCLYNSEDKSMIISKIAREKDSNSNAVSRRLINLERYKLVYVNREGMKQEGYKVSIPTKKSKDNIKILLDVFK